MVKENHSGRTQPAGVIDGLLGRVRADPLAVLDAFGAAVDMRNSIIDAHAVSAGMLLHQRRDRVVGFLAGPVALPFEQDLLPGDRNDAGLTMRSIAYLCASTDVPPEASATM